MFNANLPPESELPTSRALLRSTAIAAAVALLLLVTVVLPAEYGVDPTRVGRVLGLTQMGEIKMALAEEAAAAEAAEAAAAAGGSTAAPTPAAVPATPPTGTPATAASSAPSAAKSDVTELPLAPGEGKEIKLAMKEGASVNFSWSVQGGVVNFDTHGDRPGLDYHGYEKGQAQASDEGVLIAAFDGMHGWFFRNRTSEPVTLTLRTNGAYTELKHLY